MLASAPSPTATHPAPHAPANPGARPSRAAPAGVPPGPGPRERPYPLEPMPPSRAFPLVSRLATATATLMFGLIVVGSVVRTTGSGLACPDWPLCQGRLIPPFEFHVLIEWFHRLLALGVGLLLFATAGVALRARATRARLGGLALLAVALYFAQALLGALTVWRLLDPSVVSGHLALALLLFATLLTIALVARHESPEGATAHSEAAPGGLRALAATATVLTYAQAVLGGMVSTNHAGLACPDWPTCDGEWFPPLSGLVGLQMAHRDGAYLLLAVMAALAWRSRRAADPLVRRGGPLLLAFTLAQAALGVSNVLLGLPVWVSAMHLANAAMLLALGVAVTFRLAAQGAPAPAFAGAAAR